MRDHQIYRVRLLIRAAKGLTSSEKEKIITLSDREVILRPQRKNETLSDARWFVFGAGGFNNEMEARDFGSQLRLIVELAGLCARFGIDVGLDKATGWINEEFAKSLGILKENEISKPNIHGLMIFPEDENIRFPISEASVKVTSDPSHLLGAMEELGQQIPIQLSSISQSIRMMNLALVNNDSLARVVLSFAAVEGLGQNEKWSDEQTVLLDKIATDVEVGYDKSDKERMEIADAIRRSMHRIGLRQGVKRVLNQIGLNHLLDDWDRLYNLRSRVLHGSVSLVDVNIDQLATETVSLSGKIILRFVEQEGITLPSITSVHFP